MDITARLLWASISILFLHFFEEFRAPGGFPYMGKHTRITSNRILQTSLKERLVDQTTQTPPFG
jgi:hypothetical protein